MNATLLLLFEANGIEVWKLTDLFVCSLSCDSSGVLITSVFVKLEKNLFVNI